MNKEVIDSYLNSLRELNRYSENTVLSYQMDLNEFSHYLDSKNLDYRNLSYDDVRSFSARLNSKDKNSTIDRKISTLRGFYNYLLEQKKVEKNIFKMLPLPKKEKKLPRFFYYNELEELLNTPDITSALGARDQAIIETFYSTGVRVSELLNIKKEDIDFSSRTIKVMGKGKKERLVFFGDYLVQSLTRYLDNFYESLKVDDTHYIFLNSKGKKLTRRGAYYILDRVIKKTSLTKKISPHVLRHTFATHLLNEGCDILSVKELLGHESLGATSIYTHVTDEQIKNVYYKAHPRAKK